MFGRNAQHHSMSAQTLHTSSYQHLALTESTMKSSVCKSIVESNVRLCVRQLKLEPMKVTLSEILPYKLLIHAVHLVLSFLDDCLESCESFIFPHDCRRWSVTPVLKTSWEAVENLNENNDLQISQMLFTTAHRKQIEFRLRKCTIDASNRSGTDRRFKTHTSDDYIFQMKDF